MLYSCMATVASKGQTIDINGRVLVWSDVQLCEVDLWLSVSSCYAVCLLLSWHWFVAVVTCRNDDEDADDDDISPEDKAVREKLRRQQNNARERYVWSLYQLSDLDISVVWLTFIYCGSFTGPVRTVFSWVFYATVVLWVVEPMTLEYIVINIREHDPWNSFWSRLSSDFVRSKNDYYQNRLCIICAT